MAGNSNIIIIDTGQKARLCRICYDFHPCHGRGGKFATCNFWEKTNERKQCVFCIRGLYYLSILLILVILLLSIRSLVLTEKFIVSNKWENFIPMQATLHLICQCSCWKNGILSFVGLWNHLAHSLTVRMNFLDTYPRNVLVIWKPNVSTKVDFAKLIEKVQIFLELFLLLKECPVKIKRVKNLGLEVSFLNFLYCYSN